MAEHRFWVDTVQALASHQAGATVVFHGRNQSVTCVYPGDLVSYGVKGWKESRLLWRRVCEIGSFASVSEAFSQQDPGRIYPGRDHQRVLAWLWDRLGKNRAQGSIVVFELELITLPH